MSFTVRKVEDPTIYVRRNIKPDIFGISSAWDNIVDIKQSLSRLEGNVAAAKKHSKVGKNSHSSDGKVLKEISRETQQLGKVTRFQLLVEKHRQNDYGWSKFEGRKLKGDWSDISSIPKAGYSGLNQGQDGYSPTRYASGSKTGSTIHRERPTFFETTTIHPTILNDPHPTLNDPHPILNGSSPSKDSTLTNTSAHSLSSQQFSVTSSPSFHGKTVLARNEAALEKIKEKVRKQKEMRSKPEENGENVLDERKLHESTDHVTIFGESHEKTELKPAVPLKRKIGTISAAGPTYRGFNTVAEPKQKKVEKPKPPSHTKISKGSKDKVPMTKQRQNVEKKSRKNKMTRIVGSKRPQEVITTTSWRDGQANVKRILNARKTKTAEKQPGKGDRTQAKADKTTLRTEKGTLRNEKAPTKTNQTYDIESNDELSEGRLSSDDEDVIEKLNAKIEKFEAEKDVVVTTDETIKPSEDINLDSDDEKQSKTKEVLSKEAQSMLTDLARDSSESESEEQKDVKDEKPKSSPPKKKMLKNKKPAAVQKPTEDLLPKGKTRHYDQAEVQKYMAHQLAERKKKQKEEKMQQKKQHEEKQQRLKELYERQKKSFAPSKKDKRIGKTFSFGNFDVHVPGQEGFQAENNQEYPKDDQVVHSSTQNESDKENTDIDDEMMRSSYDASSERYTDDADVTLTEEMVTGSRETPRRRIAVEPVMSPAPIVPVLDQRAQRLTALQATALALQSRLQSHALRLSGTKDSAVPQPAGPISAQPKDVENGFQGVLPGVANIRKQADENEKQSTRVAAATKIQAAYRGHTVRKRHLWTDGKTTSERSGNTALTGRHVDDVIDKRVMKPVSFPCASDETRMDVEPALSEGSSDDVQFTNIRPFHKSELLNNDVQRAPLKVERKFQYDDLRTRSNFHRNDFSSSPVTHFTAPPVRYEPRGERFSVMNIFSRRHPTLPVDDILNEEPGSETASLLDVEKRKSPDQNVEYEDDFTDVEMSSEGDLGKDVSKAATYSECFETDEDTDTKPSKTRERSKGSRSSREAKKNEEKTSQSESGKRQLSQLDDRSKTSPLSQDDHMSSPDQHNDFILPVMASTMQPDTRRSPSLSPSEESEPIRRRPYIPKPVDRGGGDRLSPDSLQRKLTAEINLLENVEDSVRQVSDIERTRAISLAQQETVSLAQILKAKQQAHEHEMRNLAMKAKEEASQAAKDLEKTRQAAAMAATSAAERLAEVQTEAIKTNTEHSRKYMEEATRMTSGLLANTSTQLAEFCRNLTNTTSAAVEDLHKTKRPTITPVERATSISERHAMNSEHSNTSDDRIRTSNKRTRTSDDISNQLKSLRSSASGRLSRQQAGYSSDEFESYESQTEKHDDSEIKLDQASLSAESIAEDIPEKSISEDTTVNEDDTTVNEDDTTVHEDDTTVHDESGNDARDVLPREPSKKGHASVSSVLDYSSQFDDSSHALTDEDIDFNFLLPSREHRRKSIRRMKDISFDQDKRKEKSVRMPFESDDSFGKFTADMMQQYVHEEEVRTKHQAAILRLREKSLKEKTKAELQWLEEMKKQSRNKGSDDVMPSIKKRERGIRMKLKKEKEQIKCLMAANRAASIQRRFMVYQQQEIQRLHEANLIIRERIEKDTSKKGSDISSREPSQSHPKTSSPVTEPNRQSTPSSSSKSQTNQSASAKSVSEDISGQQGSSQASLNTTGSSFPSYGTPEDGKRGQPSTNVRGEQETSTILNMLSTVDVVTQRGSIQNEELLKIQKMLLERQQKLVKDESEVNSVLQKVTEMLKNQRNLGNQSATGVSEASQSKSNIPEVNQSGSRGSATSYSKHPSEQSIPEAISSIAKSVDEQIKEESTADRTANDYENATFESDDSSPRSRKSVTSLHLTSLNGEANVEEEISSLTETSDHSDVEERVRRLNEELEREKKKAEALERKKQKIKRNQARKEALKLEIEIKNTRDDNNRKLAEIKTAAAQSPTATKPHKITPRQDTTSSPQENREKSPRRSTDYTPPTSGNTSLVSDKVESKGGVGKRLWSTDHEVEESLIEVLDDNPEDRTPGTNRHRLSETSPVRTGSETWDIPEAGYSNNERDESVVEIIDEAASVRGASRDTNKSKQLEKTGAVEHQTRSTSEPGVPLAQAKDDSFDIPEEIYEHSRSTASIPEEVPSVSEDEASRKSSEIPEELSERSYTPIPSDVSDSDDSKDTHSKASSFLPESPKSARNSTSKGASYSYEDEPFENSYTEPRSSASVRKKSQNTQKHVERFTKAEVPNEKTSLEKSQSISEHLTSPADESPNVSEHLSRSPKGYAGVSDDSDSSTSEHSMVSLRKNGQSESEAIKMWTGNKRRSSDASDISNSLHSDDEISQKSKTLPRRSKANTEDEKSKSDQQVRKPFPEQRAASRSDDEKPVEHVKVSPRVDVLSPDKTGSPSEASSIAEEISGDYEDGDISESGSVLRKQQSDELIFGNTAKDERRGVDESGLDRTELDLPGLHESGLDKLEMKDYHLDTTDIDQTGSNDPEKNGTELDGSGLDKHELHETELEKPVLHKLELKESEGNKSGIKQSGGYTEISRETAADVLPVTSGEEQYSDDFDDASIQEEISEIGEEISVNAEDSDKGENFAVFVSNDKAMEGSIRRTVSREHESETRARHVVEDIANDIFRDIIADSLSSMKTVKSSKSQLAGNKISEKNELEEQDKTSFTKTFSRVTRKLMDDEGPLDTREVNSTPDGTQGGEHISVPPGCFDGDTDRITRGHTDTTVDTVGQTTTNKITEGYLDTKPDNKGVTGHSTTDSITKDLLADAIMQMIQINQRKKEKNMKLALTVETKPLETTISRNELSPPTGKTLPENIPDAVILNGASSPGKLPQAESPPGEEAAIDNALMIAKTNQILDDDALRSIDDDIAGLLGTPVDDEDEFPINITNFGSDIPSDNEASLPEYSPMLAVPHSIEELTPMVHASVDVLLEQRRLERPLKDCIPQAKFLAGETENDIECVSVQSYRHLVFDLTKEVFIDTLSQNEPATQPPWAKAKWKSGQKLSRHFKRWKSDEEIRATVLERVTNLIGLGAPRATMATIPRKTPVRGNKKDNVDAILIEELRQEEPLWTDYEEDETNVKFQVADTILNMMLEDTARVFNAIQAKKHVPDDVIVV